MRSALVFLRFCSCLGLMGRCLHILNSKIPFYLQPQNNFSALLCKQSQVRMMDGLQDTRGESSRWTGGGGRDGRKRE